MLATVSRAAWLQLVFDKISLRLFKFYFTEFKRFNIIGAATFIKSIIIYVISCGNR
jgi:hypothetical protein